MLPVIFLLYNHKPSFNFKMNKKIYFINFLLLSLFSQIALAGTSTEITLVDVIVNYIRNIGPLVSGVFIISITLGLFFIGNGAYRLTKLGKDQQIRGLGVIVRILGGGFLVILPAFITWVGGSLINTNNTSDFYSNAVENAASPGQDAVNNKGCLAGGSCDNY